MAFQKGGKGVPVHQKPGYSGFICGSKEHDFRSCPKRRADGTQSSSSTRPNYLAQVFVVVSEDESPAATTPSTSAAALATIAVQYPGHAVIDTGATDTLASLEKLEQVMNLRAQRFGPEEFVVKEERKKFRFGNGESQRATSLVEIPQFLNGQKIALGLHAIDAPGVPVLLSVRTLRKLGAIIDMDTNMMCLKNVSELWIPLKRSSNEHLLLDLTCDWYQPDAGLPAKDLASTASAYMEQPPTCQSSVLEPPCHGHESEEELLTEEQHAAHLSQNQCHHESSVNSLHAPPELEGSSTSMRVGAAALALTLAASAICPTATTSHGNTGIPSRESSGKAASGPVNTEYYDPDIDLACQGESQGQGIEIEGSSSQFGALRLRAGHWPGSPRSSSPRLSLLGTAPSDARRSWQPQRTQWPRPLDRVPEVPHQVGIHSNIWSKRHVPPGGTTAEGRADGSGADWNSSRRPSTCPRDAQQQGCGSDWCRGVNATPTSTAGERKECRHQEGCEEGQRFASGVPGIQRGLVHGVLSTSEPVNGKDYILDEPYETPLDRENDQDFQPITNQLTEHQQQVLKAQADECRSEAYGAMEQFPDPDFDISLLELCCPPDSRLAQTFLDHGKRALRVGLPAIDFGKKSGLQEVLNMIDKWKPKVLWISLPCGPYPPIQEIFNESTPEMLQKSLERKKKAKKLISHGITAARHQVNRGGEVGWEWPVNNPGWELPLVRKFWHELENAGPAFSARVDGCSYGMTGPKNMPLKKPWKIRTTSQTLARAVHRLCPGHECHEECLGGKTARDSGFYPQSMCNVIYKSVQEMMACRPNYDVFPAAYPVFDTKDMMEIEEKKKHVRPLTEEEKKQVSKLVDRLHRRTGHPSNVALAGVLRHRGAHPEVIQLAAQNQCNECQELRSAPLHAIAAIEKSETLWETVVIDNMEFTADGGIHHYMVLVDEASRLMNAYHLFSHGPAESRNATAEEVTDALGNWCLHYGMPAKVRLDPEGAFRLTLLGQWASERGIELVFCAAEDHGQIGIVERAIATLKSTIRQILQGGDYTVKQAVVSACCTHNTLERVEGYSPFQWAFGRQPTLTGRMHEKGYDDPWWTSSAVPGSSVMQNLRLRVKAQQSFLQAQSHELISRAANSKTRRDQVFVPGDLVFFKRVKPPARTQAQMRLPFKLWRWYGPARVLASETRTDGFGFQRKPYRPS